MSDGQLRKLTVLTADGQTIGAVASLQIDAAQWRVAALEVKLDREAQQNVGLHRELLRKSRLTIPIELVQGVRDKVVLSATAAELRHRVSDYSATTH